VRRRIEEILYHLNRLYPLPAPVFRDLAEEDWANAWKDHYRPFRLGRRLKIRPTWLAAEPDDDARPDDLVLVLDPGMAFGTGLHPTTQLCMMALEDHVKPGVTVFDVGHGSGVLSILAAKLGARDVLAVDTDEEAVRVGVENAIANEVSQQIRVAQGTHDSTRETFDLVVANILAGVIVKMLGSGLASRAPLFIFSGILDTQADDVIRAASDAGLHLAERHNIADWVCLVFKRH
jgi:ribosomal protein L11 methyltransferase